MNKLRIAVLISGRGSNLESLINATVDLQSPAEIVLAVSNNPDAAGLAIAERNGVRTEILGHRAFGKGESGRRAFDAALSALLDAARVEFVCLAGFMRLLSADFVDRWDGRLINIHPSLLPAFKGTNAHAATIAAGVKIAGCTVHFVTHEMDSGPIIGQAAVPVFDGDTAETLAARILEQEHRLYPECVRRIAVGEIHLRADGVVEINGAPANGALLNPAPKSPR